MWQYFVKGGITMYPLLALSVLATAIIIERFVVLYRAGTDAEAFMEKISAALEAQNYDGALQLAREGGSSIARVLASGLEKVRRGKAEVEKAIEARGNIEVAKFERGLPFLKAVINTAPLLGFYGTVSGMITAFESMGLKGLADMSSMSLGISEALITTAAGLIVAIPVAFINSLFVGRVNRFVHEIQQVSVRFLDALEEVEEKQARKLLREQIGGDYLEA